MHRLCTPPGSFRARGGLAEWPVDAEPQRERAAAGPPARRREQVLDKEANKLYVLSVQI